MASAVILHSGLFFSYSSIDMALNSIFLQVFPSQIPDLQNDSPLVISGRYQGKFPETVKVKGIFSDMSNLVVDLKTETDTDIPLERVRAELPC